MADSVLGPVSGAAYGARASCTVNAKPGNILLTEDGTFKVCDFGIVMLLHAGETTSTSLPSARLHTHGAGTVCGGPGATERSDLYALGVVLY